MTKHAPPENENGRTVNNLQLALFETSPQFTRGIPGANKEVLELLLSLPGNKKSKPSFALGPKGSAINRHVPRFLNSLKSSGQRNRSICAKELNFQYTLFHSAVGYCPALSKLTSCILRSVIFDRLFTVATKNIRH